LEAERVISSLDISATMSTAAAAPASAASEATDKAPAPEAAATSDAAESKEEEDCGFCTYMRAGPCGEVFTAWEKCVEDHRSRDEDFAKGCVPATRALTECMSEHKDYYELPDQEPAPAPETAPIAAATVADAPAATASVESAGDAAESRAAAA
jgi:intermembrane space import and assembly protein 40